MTEVYPRETVVFQPVPVTVSGTLVLTGVTLAVVPQGTTRPISAGAFAAPVTLGGQIGFMITGLDPGFWDVYAKVASTPETPVIYCGYIQIT